MGVKKIVTIAASAAPPSTPGEHIWHIAKAGKATGSFSKASLDQMAFKCTLTHKTTVWTQDQDGWMAIDKITKLPQLFTIRPPSLPQLQSVHSFIEGVRRNTYEIQTCEQR